MSKNKLQPLIMLLAGILLTSITKAQESANSSGGNAIGSGGTVSYSIGQVDFNSNSGSSGSVAQGVQHAYEIFTVGINETTLNISLTAYPNPTTDNLTLQINDYKNEKLTYQLFDIQGKLITNGQVISKQTIINTVSLQSATYFIHLVNNDKTKVQSFKIIKN
jgi:hypothetical protein